MQRAEDHEQVTTKGTKRTKMELDGLSNHVIVRFVYFVYFVLFVVVPRGIRNSFRRVTFRCVPPLIQ